MKLIKLTLLLVVVVLFSIACNKPSSPTANNGPGATSAPATATPDEFAGPRANFAKNCVTCHGTKGDGGPVTVEGHKLKVPALREGHALHHPDSDFVDQITKGGDGMPAFKDKLKPEEITDLVRFIRHEFQGGRTPPPEPAKPMKNMPKNMPM
jgi:mono/diheme cytochrome c family protein